MSTSFRIAGMDGIIVISGNFIELSVSKPKTSKPFLAKFFCHWCAHIAKAYETNFQIYLHILKWNLELLIYYRHCEIRY